MARRRDVGRSGALIGVDETLEAPEAVETAFELFGADSSYTIVCIYERQPFIVIVIGSHDRGLWERLFTPSVGTYLVERAPCPVLVVR